LVICYIAIENGSSTVDLPIPNGDNGDFPYYQRVNPKNISPQFVMVNAKTFLLILGMVYRVVTW